MATHWSQQLHSLLKQQNIRQVSFVPDAVHTALIKLCEADATMRAVRLTTEEEGVALAVGAWLGGDKSVLLMQSSGVGNCINMLSMLSVCQIPLTMLVTMRGDWAEFNPWQVPMGHAGPAAARRRSPEKPVSRGAARPRRTRATLISCGGSPCANDDGPRAGLRDSWPPQQT